MNKIIYNVGDLVLAHKNYDINSPNYEWWPYDNNCPLEYAIITKIINMPDSYEKYYVKFIDGSEDFMDAYEIKLRASCLKKISREVAAAPLERNIKDL